MAETTPAGAVTQPPAPNPESSATPPSAAKTEPGIKDRLARLQAKHRKELDEAANRAREEAIAEFRAEHGLDDDALTQWANRDKAAAEERSRKAEVTKAKNEADRAAKERDKYRTALDNALRKSAVLAEAASQDAIDAETVWLHMASITRLTEQGDEFTVVVLDEKGEPTEVGIADAIKDLLTKKPHLARSRLPGGSGSRITEFRTADKATDRFKTPQDRIANLKARVGG